ncbi:hypothetical protein ALC57_04316 [Trachymyrmex cornetzi]|uniref:Uncharacterized protein n=1 Tax=Trachymyrmex cornetzi TaxID=471704 RepID=A0A195EF58_9HYME|nr:hypothetical protein ALC57_04316 [Trachymyrmex cornetzi]
MFTICHSEINRGFWDVSHHKLDNLCPHNTIYGEKVACLKDYYNQDAHSRLNKVEQSIGIVNNEARGIGPVEFVINPTFSVRVCAS